MSTDNLFTERLILELVFGSLPFLSLFILGLLRIFQILHLPSHNRVGFTVSLRIKILLTLCLSTILILIPILTYIFNDCWFNNQEKEFTFVFLGQAVILIFQVILMGYEFKKQVPTPWYINLLFWAVITLFYFIFLMNSLIFLDFNDNAFLTIDVLRLFFAVILLIYGIVQKQDIENIRHQPHFFTKPLLASRKYSLIENIEKKNFMMSPTSPQPISSQIRISVKHRKKNNSFDLKVSLPDITYTISQTLKQITEIEARVLMDFQHRKFDNKVQIPEICKNIDNPLKVSSSIETYFRFFIENEALITARIISFLQIPNPYKRKLLKTITENQKKNEEFSLNPNQSLSSQASKSQVPEESENNNSLNNNSLCSEQPEKYFCLFFLVEFLEFRRVENHYEYMFMLTLKALKGEKKWTIVKRYKDFLALEEAMKKNLKGLPKLPGKTWFHNEENLSERCQNLESYLRLLLNESLYLFNEDLLLFIEYAQNESGNLVFSVDSQDFPNIKECYRSFQAREFETKISLENDGTQFISYIITIEEKDRFKCRIAKRYTDFEKLHESLVARFNKANSFPELPGKLDFNQVRSRGERLLEYINGLFAMKGIEDSFTFRKFMGIDVKNLVN